MISAFLFIYLYLTVLKNFQAFWKHFVLSVFLFFFLTSLLEYNCFTMVCYFLLYNKVNQLYIYICSHISSLKCISCSTAYNRIFFFSTQLHRLLIGKFSPFTFHNNCYIVILLCIPFTVLYVYHLPSVSPLPSFFFFFAFLIF